MLPRGLAKKNKAQPPAEMKKNKAQLPAEMKKYGLNSENRTNTVMMREIRQWAIAAQGLDRANLSQASAAYCNTSSAMWTITGDNMDKRIAPIVKGGEGP